MKTFPSLLKLLLIIVSLTIFSCKKEQDSPGLKVEIQKNDKTLASIKAMGYKDSEIKDMGDFYTVQGDMAFYKEFEEPTGKELSPIPSTKQYSTGNSIGYYNQNIVIQIDASMSSYTSEISSAVAMWAAVPNCRLTFSVYDGSVPANILIKNEGLMGLGLAFFPRNGQAGGTIKINRSLMDSYSSSDKISVIAHEIGHTIGFRHTNWAALSESRGGSLDGALFNAFHIVNTPAGNTDSNSIMMQGVLNTSLSTYDIVALEIMYPANAPATGTVPVFRYLGGSDGKNHFYTTNYAELGDGSQSSGSYIFEGIGFFAYNSNVTSTVPVYRHYSSSRNDHFYTVDINFSYPGYVYQGIAFYAYPSQINGSLPIYQYYQSSSDDHFYTKNTGEFYYGFGGYSFQQTAFYAY